ncbi:tetratricopeptide repeat protein [Pseudomonas prosekii]|uniref:tetratricopeptide repeat protein n=1 Tax=Pseudomonas prosekii TaxID=1148509 RepID=UPI003F74E179
MKAATKFFMFAFALFFVGVSIAQDSLSLYASSSGSAAITEHKGSTSLLVVAGGNDAGEATSGSCVIAASLTAVKGGFEGEFIPVNTALTIYGDDQAEGKRLQIENSNNSITINDADYIGICALDSSLINRYEQVTPADKRHKHVFAEMIDLAHADALYLFKKGQKEEAIVELTPYVENYQTAWLSDKELGGAVISAINDYGYFLQENNKYLESIPFLNDVVGAQPKRAAAWLNLADSNWAIGEKSDAVKQYAEYKRLMIADNKKSKIPPRVFERVSTAT